MVSDLCQALERDNIFGNSEDSKMMVVREPEENEMVPAIIKEGKTVKEFDPEFFIVSLSNGQPKDESQDYKILKNYDFLAQNRRMKPNKTDFKKYINAHKGDKSVNKFA
jgi:nuclear protein localization family protein 4